MDHVSVNRDVLAGDPFPLGATHHPDLHRETHHGCIEGWVYLGFEGEDEDGEPAEVIERVRCRRCQRS